MPEQPHTQDTAKTAAYDRNGQQGLFRNAPGTFLRFDLIGKHKKHADCIDYKQVDDPYRHIIILSQGGMTVKKVLFAFAVTAILLCGCATPKAYETIQDPADLPQQATPLQPVVELPQEAVQQTLATDDNNTVYFCDGYVLTLEVVDGGDLQKTFLQTTGFSPEQLCVIKTKQSNADCYRAVWTSAGDSGDQVGQCAVLDDGNYHYILSVMADAEVSGELSNGAWQTLFRSFRLMDPADVVSSGS